MKGDSSNLLPGNVSEEVLSFLYIHGPALPC